MLSIIKFCASLFQRLVLVMLAATGPLASAVQPIGESADKLPLSRESVAGPSVRRLPTSVQWQSQEYGVDFGIDVLMSAVRDAPEGTDQRERALVELALLKTHLEGRRCIDELAKLYDLASESEKYGILICLKASDDPRGIQLFMHVLNGEKNMKLRLSAAGALAHWNIRRGVAELVKLLESKEMLSQPARIPYVRDNALELFETKNSVKGWGFPAKDIRKSIETRPGMDREQFVTLYVAEIKKWWGENGDRFPDWMPGDPLPLIEPGKESNR